MENAETRRSNRLIHEKSPYLLQHAHNPVDWYPWGDEAFRRAKVEDKPVFLSIGYATCHWCHVMERESFEDPEIAALLNQNFVSIKVDREERPDIDQTYMTAVQGMTGQGGWPLSVFLTPQGGPFFGGTYFPPRDRGGMSGFPTVLAKIAEAWRTRRAELERAGAQFAQSLEAALKIETRGAGLSAALLDEAYRDIASSFDERGGGFGTAPKFPQVGMLLFLMRHHHRTRERDALRMVRRTLDAMADGGIYDQLGGGFHRYAVDQSWLVPHFEKMLYDNALLASGYIEAHRLTKEPRYAQIAAETLDYVLRDMSAPEGCFYTAEDADSEGEEGRFYTWTPSEVREVLQPAQAELAMSCWGVTERGNFEGGRSVLHVVAHPRDDALNQSLASARKALLGARAGRPRPLRDDKILTGWNGLMISAMCSAYQVLAESRFLEAAQRAAGFIIENMMRDGLLLRRWREGDAAIPGFLEDYAFFAQGLIDLYESDFDAAWMTAALQLNQEILSRFGDPGGGFFDSAEEHASPVVRARQQHDASTPSGNSVAVMNLLRLSQFAGDAALRERSRETLEAMQAQIEAYPAAFPYALCAVDYLLARASEIVIAGWPNHADTKEMLTIVRAGFLPNKIVALADPDDEEAAALFPLIHARKPRASRPTAYVCESFACREPTTDPQQLQALLTAGASSRGGSPQRPPGSRG